MGGVPREPKALLYIKLTTLHQNGINQVEYLYITYFKMSPIQIM